MFKSLSLMLAMVLTMAFGQFSFAVGTSVVTKSTRVLDHGKKVYVYKIVSTGDASTGAIPDASLVGVHGYLMKVITNPGATAPTDNYDIVINDADDATLDAANSLLLNRDTANTEAVYPVGITGVSPLFFQPGTYTAVFSNQSVNSAGVVVWMYFIDDAAASF